MAKSQLNKTPRYVCLGATANSFYDPISNLKLNKRTVLKLTPKQLSNKLVREGLKGGHLEYADKADFDKYTKSQNKTGKVINLNEEEEEEEDEEEEEEEEEEEDDILLEDLPSNKDAMIQWLIENSVALEMNKSEEELNAMNKPAVKEYAEGLFD